MANGKRARKQISKQERAVRQQKAREAERARKQRRGLTYALSVAVVVILGVFGVLGGNLRNKKNDTKTPTSVAQSNGEVTCPNADGSSPLQRFFAKEPPRCIDATRQYRATINTTAGKIVVELYPDKAFRAVNNFIFLARYHFYDQLPFHRVSKDIFIQTGDPIAPGITGPGYVFKDDGLPASAAEYTPGALLFAHEAANQNGSQFLIVSGPGGTTLNPTFPLFGRVLEGMDVVARINAGAGENVAAPAKKYQITNVDVEVVKD